MTTNYETVTWCDEQINRIKGLQDICLDNFNNKEIKKTLKRLSIIQAEIEDLYAEYEHNLF